MARTTLKLISFSSLWSVFVGALLWMLGIRDLFQVEYATGVPRLAGSTIPAFLGALSISASVSSLYLWLSGDRVYKYLFLFSITTLFLTLGRMAVFVGSSLAIVTFLSSGYVSLDGKKRILLLVLIVAFVVSLFLAPNAIERFQSSGLSGREELWGYIKYLSSKYPNFGIGFGHQFLSTPREIIVSTASWSAHNEYLRLNLELGRYFSVVFLLFYF